MVKWPPKISFILSQLQKFNESQEKKKEQQEKRFERMNINQKKETLVEAKQPREKQAEG